MLITAVAGYVGLVLGVGVLESVARASCRTRSSSATPRSTSPSRSPATVLLIVRRRARRLLPGAARRRGPPDRRAAGRVREACHVRPRPLAGDLQRPAPQQAAHLPHRVRRLLGHLHADGDARLRATASRTASSRASRAPPPTASSSGRSARASRTRACRPGAGSSSTTTTCRRCAQQMPEVEVVAPRNQLGGFRGGNNVTRGDKTGAFTVMRRLAREPGRSQSLRMRAGPLPQPARPRRAAQGRGDRQRACRSSCSTRARSRSASRSRSAASTSRSSACSSRQQLGRAAASARRRRSSCRSRRSSSAFNFGDRVGWFAITSRPGVPRVAGRGRRSRRSSSSATRSHPTTPRAFGHFNMEEEFGKIQRPLQRHPAR